MKEENNTEGLYYLKIDARHYFPDGKIARDVLEALRCRQYAAMLAFYLERDLDDIEKQARRLAESTSLSYSEALHKIGGDMLRSKEKKPAPLCPLAYQTEPVRPNRAARRAAQKKRRTKWTIQEQAYGLADTLHTGNTRRRGRAGNSEKPVALFQ